MRIDEQFAEFLRRAGLSSSGTPVWVGLPKASVSISCEANLQKKPCTD